MFCPLIIHPAPILFGLLLSLEATETYSILSSRSLKGLRLYFISSYLWTPAWTYSCSPKHKMHFNKPFPFQTMLWQKHASNQEVVNKYHKPSVSSQKYLYGQYMIFPEMLGRWVIAHCVFGRSWPPATVAPANQSSGKQSSGMMHTWMWHLKNMPKKSLPFGCKGHVGLVSLSVWNVSSPLGCHLALQQWYCDNSSEVLPVKKHKRSISQNLGFDFLFFLSLSVLMFKIDDFAYNIHN